MLRPGLHVTLRITVVPIARAADVEVFETTAFVDHGAAFNKGYALEQGFDVRGRHGWIAIIDTDIVLPPYMPWMHFRGPQQVNLSG